jgi:hypothetical protein
MDQGLFCLFFGGYITAALCSSDSDTEASLSDNYFKENIEADTLSQMQRDCEKFYTENDLETLLKDDYQNMEQAGHDFWFTRNGHGVGFWEREWIDLLGEEASKKLTDSSRAFGEYYLEESDGKVIGYGG